MNKNVSIILGSLVFCGAILSPKLNAQQFKSYNQAVPGETISIDMVSVDGGSFTMGTNSPERKSDEKPAHSVNVNSFWIGKYEITWEQYDAFVYGKFGADQFKEASALNKLGIDAVSGATAPYVDMSFGMGKVTNPVVNITQYAAIMYCKWLTAKTGKFFRLPTEAEWEYVCKKGKTDDVNDLKLVGWFAENSNEKYQKIGGKNVNGLGIHDLLGNVSEWVMDQYSADYYGKSVKSNPWNVPTKLYPRVVRGGAWKDTADKLCCTSRQGSKQNWKQRDPQIPKSNWWHTNAPFIGFRVVRPKQQPTAEQIEAYWLEVIVDYGMD